MKDISILACFGIKTDELENYQIEDLSPTAISFIMMLCKEVNQNSGVIYSFISGESAKISYKILKNNYRHLNDIFFDKKIENNEKVVYAKACDDLFDMIEIMRASFYHKKYVKKDHYPALRS